MTNILSTLRGSGIFCVKLVRKTSKLLSRIINFYANGDDVNDAEVDDASDVPDSVEDEDYDNVGPPPVNAGFRWPSTSSGFVPESPPSRSDSQCSCLSCALPPRLTERERRPSRLVEGVSAENFYRLGDLLGEGTFSRVYLAEPLQLPGGLVAVKVIEKSSWIRKKAPEDIDDNVIPEEADSSEIEDLRWLIDREIQVMTALDHPHIIHLEEVYEDDDQVYFILELAKVIFMKYLLRVFKRLAMEPFGRRR